MSCWIDLNHAPIQQQGDIAIVIKSCGMDQDAIKGLFAGEIFFGQRRALIGDFRFVPDDANTALEFLLSKHCGGLRTAMTAADDDNFEFHPVKSSSASQRSRRGSLCFRSFPSAR
jgi:hypothetical protein